MSCPSSRTPRYRIFHCCSGANEASVHYRCCRLQYANRRLRKTRNESFRQIFTTLGWTPPSAFAFGFALRRHGVSRRSTDEFSYISIANRERSSSWCANIADGAACGACAMAQCVMGVAAA
jgi:hypothetical protein